MVFRGGVSDSSVQVQGAGLPLKVIWDRWTLLSFMVRGRSSPLAHWDSFSF